MRSVYMRELLSLFLIIRFPAVYFLIPGREKVERYHNT